MYSTFNEGKAVVIERFNRTLKNKMYKYFTANNTCKYVDVLPDVIYEYNNHKHSTINMTPTEASMKYNEKVIQNDVYSIHDKTIYKSKFMVEDRVRISKYKRTLFDKGYTPNWSEEVFVIVGIQHTNPTTYIIKDYNNEIIEGSFYENELKKTDQDFYRIDKVIKKDYKKKLALVSWKGYPKEFNSWISLNDVKKKFKKRFKENISFYLLLITCDDHKLMLKYHLHQELFYHHQQIKLLYLQFQNNSRAYDF